MIRQYWNIYMNEMTQEQFYTVDNIACMATNGANVMYKMYAVLAWQLKKWSPNRSRVGKFAYSEHVYETVLCLFVFVSSAITWTGGVKYQIGIHVLQWGRMICETGIEKASVREWRKPSDILVHGVI